MKGGSLRLAPVLAAIAALLVVACQPAAPAQPAPPPVEKAPAEPAAKQPAAKPDVKPAEPEPDAWEQVVQAARAEGRIGVIGPQGVAPAEALTTGFREKYPEIELEFQGIPGREVAPKLTTELAAGQYLTDVVVAGTTTQITALRPADALQPIHPFLTGPATRDPSVWWQGRFHFSDDADEYNFVFSTYVKAPFVYNTELVSPDEFTSYRDLLDPKWRGQIAVGDPRVSGSGQAVASFWYTNPNLGPEFIQEFFSQQEPVILRDDRQLLDFVGQGSHPIGVGPGDVPAVEAIRRGLPIDFMHQLAEGAYITAGNGSVSVVNNTPRPNATTLYLDWLLSAEGQLAWSEAVGFESMRRDIPNDHVPEAFRLQEGVDYQPSHTEQYLRMRDEIVEFLNTVITS